MEPRTGTGGSTRVLVSRPRVETRVPPAYDAAVSWADAAAIPGARTRVPPAYDAAVSWADPAAIPGARTTMLPAGSRVATLLARARVTMSAGTTTRSRAVDELVHYRHDLADAAGVESAVRAAGGFPTQGGGTRVAALPSRAPATTEGPA